eukprot:4304805-Pleurochrysis_carterae.AAC.1
MHRPQRHPTCTGPKGTKPTKCNQACGRCATREQSGKSEDSNAQSDEQRGQDTEWGRVRRVRARGE